MNKGQNNTTEKDPLKTYVDVSAVFTRKGVMLPRLIAWDNGKVYQISKVKSIHRASDRNAHDYSLCYICIINGQEATLYYDGNFRWFLNRKVPASKTANQNSRGK